MINRDDTALKEIALVTQMRAGTHYLCLALRLAMEATIYRPNRRAEICLDGGRLRSEGLARG